MELLRFFNTRSEFFAKVELAIIKNKEEIHISSVPRKNFCIRKVVLVGLQEKIFFFFPLGSKIQVATS